MEAEIVKRDIIISLKLTEDEAETLHQGILENFDWGDTAVGSREFWSMLHECLDRVLREL